MVHKGFVIDFAYIIEDRIPYQHTNEYIHTYKYIHIISHTELLQQKGHTNSFGFTCRNYYCQNMNPGIVRKHCILFNIQLKFGELSVIFLNYFGKICIIILWINNRLTILQSITIIRTGSSSFSYSVCNNISTIYCS